MSPVYEVYILSAAGAVQTQFTDYLYLTYTLSTTRTGGYRFQVRDGHPVLSYLAEDAQIEIWKEDAATGIGRQRVFGGFVGDELYASSAATVVTLSGPEQTELLARRDIAWKEKVDLRSNFENVVAETILKNLVTYNATTSATIGNGRLLTGDFGSKTITVQADGAAGNKKSWSGAHTNLLETLRKVVASGAGGDFALVKTGVSTWDFRWYLGQLGTDRSATLTFSLERGNMDNAQYLVKRNNTKSAVVVGGPGEDPDRPYVARYSAAWTQTTQRETFVDGRNFTTTQGWESLGDQALFNSRSKPSFSFKPLQEPNAVYGRDYFLGDLVTAAYRTITSIQKVTGVTVTFTESGDETIDVEMTEIG